MIKFEHSVFALPFALTGALLAFRDSGYDSQRIWAQAAVDRGGDGGRRAPPPWPSTGWWMPRSTRAIRAPGCATCPPGCSPAVSPGASWRRRRRSLVRSPPAQLNPLCLRLAPVALAIVFFYSFTKRFTTLSHLVLGLSPGDRAGGGLDRRARLARPAHSLADRRGHVLDRRVRRHLFLPGLRIRLRRGAVQRAARRWASPAALRVARALHVLMVVCLLALVYTLHLGALALAGVARHRGAAGLRAQPGEAARPLARQRGLLHHERLRERVILSILGC